MDGSKPAATGTTATEASSNAATPGQRRGRAEKLADAPSPPTLNQIRYPCLMNMDYHAAREAWLDRIHRWLMFTVIVAGASAFIELWPESRAWSAVISMVAGTLDLTFDLSNRARNHAVFRRRYAEILADASRSPDRLGVQQCELDELSGEEEPPFHAQMALSSMRAQQQTYGEICDPCRPGWLARLFANVIRFDGRDFLGTA